MRATLAGRKGEVAIICEVMGILPGLHLVDCSKAAGDSVDFYDLYTRITSLIQPLITADALQRADSGGHRRHPSAHASANLATL
jgi:hypothetical protein